MLSLLFVLAVVGMVARRQIQASHVVATPARTSASAAPAANASTLPEQARALQDHVREETVRALQLGADRAASAEQ
ncbi:MAG: hypothetical protein M3Z29_05490 [Pseudomonadota bacterium]|nr:hypothetical protein [Pseudomonadota bacterium]